MTMWLLMIVTQFISPLVFLVLGQNSRFIRANALIALGVELFAYLVFLLLVVGANFAGSYDSVFY